MQVSDPSKQYLRKGVISFSMVIIIYGSRVEAYHHWKSHSQESHLVTEGLFWSLREQGSH